MILGSLLSGIGSMDLGFALAGWDIGWQVEIDPFRRAILSRAWPEVPRHEDILTLDPRQLSHVDCIQIDCPRHCYRDPEPLFDAGLRIVLALSPRFFLVQHPIAVHHESRIEDWESLKRKVEDLGYEALWLQISYDIGLMRWERQFMLGHCGPVGVTIQKYAGGRACLGVDGRGEIGPGLRYGMVKIGDITAGERDWCLPPGWMDVSGATMEQRRAAIMDATPVLAAQWWGECLSEGIAWQRGAK